MTTHSAVSYGLGMWRSAALLVLLALPATAQTITDGDTIKLNGTTYRLWGARQRAFQESEAERRPAVEHQAVKRGGAVAPAPRVLAPVGGPARPPEEGAVVQGVVHPARPIRIKLFHWSHEEVTPAKALRCLRSRN
jgi:hypothetical protein